MRSLARTSTAKRAANAPDHLLVMWLMVPSRALATGAAVARTPAAATAAAASAPTTPLFAPSATTASSSVSSSSSSSSTTTTLKDVFDASAKTFDYRDAYIDMQQKFKWTFSEVKKHSNAIGDGLYERFIRRGHRVFSAQGGSTEEIMTHIGAARSGVSMVLGAPCAARIPMQPDELKSMLNLTKSRGLLLNPHHQIVKILREISPELISWNRNQTLDLDELPNLRSIFQTTKERVHGMERFSNTLRYNFLLSQMDTMVVNASDEFAATVQNNAIRSISHGDAVASARVVATTLGWNHDDRVATQWPTSDPVNAIISIWAPLSVGGVFIVTGKQTDSHIVTANAIKNESATSAVVLSSYLTAHADAPATLARLRSVVIVERDVPIDQKTVEDIVKEVPNVFSVRNGVLLNEKSGVSTPLPLGAY